ncbi:MAG: OmpA family protein [Bacteroidales bacterium]|nr:OmpA family protein [Bacteroidales bacterium]
MKKLVVILTVFLACAFVSNAQSQETFQPGWKLSTLGGINYATSDKWALDFFQHVTPTGQIGVEYNFVPWFSVRGTLSGPIGAYPLDNGTSIGKFAFVQLGADAIVDFSNILNYKSTRAINPYLFLGVAAVDRFKTAGAKNYFGVGLRGGIGFNFRLSDAVKLVLEVQENALGPNFNSLDDNLHYGAGKGRWRRLFQFDDNLAALAGLQFNLGANKRKAEEAAKAEQRAAAQAAAAAAAQATNPRELEEKVTFEVNRTNIPIRENSKLRRIITSMNMYPDSYLVITGFADISAPTSNNSVLSQERVEVIKMALTDAGIPASRIVTNYYGDASLVEGEPDKARVVILVTK